jgi:hypothetical protein
MLTLEQQRAIDTCSLSGVGLIDWSAVGGCVDCGIAVGEDLLARHCGGRKEERYAESDLYTFGRLEEYLITMLK